MAAVPRTRRGLRWALTQSASYDVVQAVVVTIVTSVSAWLQFDQRHLVQGWTLIGCATVVFIVAVVRCVVLLSHAQQKESPHDLEGCLHTLHAVLQRENEPTATLRLAIHVPVPGKPELEQVTEYIGVPPKAGRRGRLFPANAGIIGKAYRQNE